MRASVGSLIQQIQCLPSWGIQYRRILCKEDTWKLAI